MKRSIDIEQLLTWTFVDELPKRNLSSAEANWENISAYGGNGGVSIGGGSTPQRYAAITAPHPDAVIVGHQVEGIAALLGSDTQLVSVDYAASRPTLFGDILRLSPLAMSLPPFNVLVMVKSMAVLKRRPRWNVGALRPQRTLGTNGKVMLVGECRGRDLYAPGSYNPITWTPSIREIAEARAEYLLWHRALTVLADALADSLVAHAPTRPAAPQTPWLGYAEQETTVWRNPLVTQAVIAAVKNGRKRHRRSGV